MFAKNFLVTLAAVMATLILNAQTDYSQHTVFCTGLNVPNQIVFDSSGNLFVANHSYASYSGPYNNTIAKIDPAGNKSVFVSGYQWPSGLEIDNLQNLYMTQNNASMVIRKITPAGTVTTFASLPHAPGPITLFDNNNNPQFAIYTVSHYGLKGIQKTDYAGNHAQFAAGSFHGCQISSDGQYLYVFNSTSNQMLRYNTPTGASEPWISQIQNYEIFAGTIGPDNKLYVIGLSNCATGKKSVYRINGQNSFTEFVTNLPANHEFNDLAFKQNGASWDLYLSEVAAGGRMDPASNRIIRFSDVFASGAIQITVDPCNNSLCQGDSATFTAFGLSGLSAGTLQWYVNGVPVSGGGNLSNGLVAHYPFNGTLADATGNCQNAVTNGNVSPATDRFGVPNHAYYIGGNSSGSDYLTVAHDDSLVVHNPFSVSVWINKEAHGGWIINKGRDIVNGYGIYDGGCNAQVLYAGNNGAGVTNNTTISLNEWHLYTGVFNGDSAYFYLDGVLASKKLMASNSYVSYSTDYPLAFGRHFTNCCYNPSPSYYSYPYKGKIDDVRLYNYALSAYEAWRLYTGSDTTYSYVPQNGDTVYCVYTFAGTPAVIDTSNFIIMQVNPLPADIGETSADLSSLSGGLVLYYPFSGNASDHSGNANHGVVTGATLSADRFNHPNSAYFFDGSNDLVQSVNNVPITGNSPKSMSVWINASSYKDDMATICGWGDASATGALALLHLYKVNSRICFHGHQGYGQTNDFFSDPNSAPLNEWIHVGWKYDGVWAYLYINGIKTDSLDPTSSLITASNKFKVGFDPSPFNPMSGWNQYFHGKIDDIRVYNRAISDAEMWYLYSGGPVLSVILASDTICNGSSASLQIFNSQPSIHYQLLKNGLNFGPSQTGNGDTLTFPISGMTATSIFTIHALNPATGCNRMLDTTLTLTVVPFNPAVSPDTTTCSGSNVVLQAFGGANYLWSNGMTSPQITVAPLATTTYAVTVTNAEGCSGSDSVVVTVVPGPQPTISGPGAICLGTNNAIYSTEPGKSNYTWTITGGTITAGAGTNTITVTWNTLGTQSVGVNYANAQGCMASTPATLAITVNPMAAPVITGSTNMCVNSGYYYYSTDPGMNNYMWSASPGATIIWGNGTPDLIVTWDQPGAQWVAVNYTNGSGCTALSPTQFSVTVNPLPGPAGTITGPVTVCAGSTGVAYSTNLISNTNTYIWSLPPGASVASGNGTNAITVDFSTSAQPGTLSVYGNNLCGNGSFSFPLSISVGALPGIAGIPVGEPEVCEGDTGIVYYVPPIFNASTYVWEILGGGVITGGNGTNSIRAKFPVGPASCTITVYGANSCGAGLISAAKIVLVNPLPPKPVITQVGEQLVSSAITGNQWYFNGSPIPGATQQTLLPEQSGEYMVVTIQSGCISEKSDEFYYIVTGLNPFSSQQIFVYPIPNYGKFSVEIAGAMPEPVTVSVFNGLGVKMHSQNAEEATNGHHADIELRPVAPGVYTVMIEYDATRWVRKIIVTR